MKKINWPDLSTKLVDRFDMNDTLSFIQKALGDLALTMFGPGVQSTPDFLDPFGITLSGAGMTGTVDAGIGYDDNGQVVVVPDDGNAFTIEAAHSSLERWDLLVLKYGMDGNLSVPKPTAPLTDVFYYLIDSFSFAVRKGTASGSPAYPAKQAGDIIVAGIKVPAGVTLASNCEVDDTVQERGFLPVDKVQFDPTNFEFTKTVSTQSYIELLDAFLLAGPANQGDDGAAHDYAEVTCNSAGVGGDTLTLGAKTWTIGSGLGQIPVQATAIALAKYVARLIREDGTVGPTHYAVASRFAKIGITAKAQGAVGTALSKTGTSFSVSAATLAGNGARGYATAVVLKKQVDQLDAAVTAALAALVINTPWGLPLPWFTEVAPSGHAEMDGRSVLRATYPNLFAVWGTRYGAADGTHFNFPDTRGQFLRGWDHARGLDPDAGTRLAPTATGATIAAGDHVGTTQADAFENHSHTIDTRQSQDGGAITSEGGSLSTGSVTGATGGNETRPTNMAVMWVVRLG